MTSAVSERPVQGGDELRLYCDLSAILAHARRHTTVTGIQRVILRVIGHLVASHGTDAIRGIAWHPKLRCVVEIDLSFLGPDYRFEAHHAEFLRDMGLPFDASGQDRALLRRLAAKIDRLQWKLGGSPAFGRRLSVPSIRPDDRIFLPVPTLRNTRYVDYLCGRRKAGNIILQLVHDVIPLMMPGLAKPGHDDEFRRFLDRVADYVSGFLCVSDQTEIDLRAVLPAAGRSIGTRVTPLAHEFIGDTDDAIIRPTVEAIGRTPFVLCVGTIEARKNTLALCRIWQGLPQELGGVPPRLVLAGQRGWHTDEVFDLLSATRNLNGTVTVIPTPSDAELAFLYRHCAFTVFPSLYEGWGLPIGESLWFGKYCIASRAASMPQVGGDLVDYVDPQDTDDMRRVILRAIREPDYVRAREGRIRVAALRGWDETAQGMYTAVWAAADMVEATDRPMVASFSGG